MQIEGELIPTWRDFVQLCAAEFQDVWHFRGALDDRLLESALLRTTIQRGTY